MAAKGQPSPRLNRIYIRQADIAASLYRRSKELGFTTEDVMRLHWDRQGKRALDWARTMIKRMRKAGLVDVVDTDRMSAPEGDRRRRLYRFTEEALKEWNLHDPNASSCSTTDTSSRSSTGEATSASSMPLA